MNKASLFMERLRGKKREVQFLCVFIFTMLFIYFSPYGITFVMTPSIAEGVYFKTPVGELKRGQTYCARFGRPDWLPDEINIPDNLNACKYLIGMPGDVVKTEDGVVSVFYKTETDVSGVEVETQKSYVRKSSFKGLPLLAPEINGVIPEGSYFFASDKELGWDSRYIGLIKYSELKSKVNLLYEF